MWVCMRCVRRRFLRLRPGAEEVGMARLTAAWANLSGNDRIAVASIRTLPRWRRWLDETGQQARRAWRACPFCRVLDRITQACAGRRGDAGRHRVVAVAGRSDVARAVRREIGNAPRIRRSEPGAHEGVDRYARLYRERQMFPGQCCGRGAQHDGADVQYAKYFFQCQLTTVRIRLQPGAVAGAKQRRIARTQSMHAALLAGWTPARQIRQQ